MKKGQDLVAEFPGLVIIHQKIPGREVASHSHQEHEFFLPLQGEITLTFADQKISGGPGRMIYAPPHLDHTFLSSASGEGERVIFLIQDKVWKKYGGGEFLPGVRPRSSLVFELIFFLLLNPKSNGVATFISALVNALSDHLQFMERASEQGLQLDHLKGRIQDPRIKKAILALQNLEDQRSMAVLADQSGLSVRNFNRLFLSEVGMTPKKYTTLLRIEKAKVLLTKSMLTITDISIEVGYQSLSKFIATFRRYSGRLPSDYRERFRDSNSP